MKGHARLVKFPKRLGFIGSIMPTALRIGGLRVVIPSGFYAPFLKAADLCATDPPRAARQLVDRGFTTRYDYALQTLSENPYDKWREYDAQDTVRFYALRLHETGFIKSSPQKIIADGADWRFLNEIKRELKT